MCHNLKKEGHTLGKAWLSTDMSVYHLSSEGYNHLPKIMPCRHYIYATASMDKRVGLQNKKMYDNQITRDFTGLYTLMSKLRFLMISFVG